MRADDTGRLRRFCHPNGCYDSLPFVWMALCKTMVHEMDRILAHDGAFYSARRASTGWTLVALRAGKYVASSAATANAIETAA